MSTTSRSSSRNERKRSRSSTPTAAAAAVLSSSADDDPMFASTHQQALELEVSLLEALLRRNRASHGRTKYYQRLSMARQALQRHDVLQIYPRCLQTAAEQQDQKKQTKRRAITKDEEVFWSLVVASNNNNDKKKAVCSKKSKGSEIDRQKEQQQQLAEKNAFLQLAQHSILQGLPECVDRLEHAATALFQGEVSRGFFLPFCTVAVGAVSRIRTLLVRLGRYVTTVNQTVVQRLVAEHQQTKQSIKQQQTNDDDDALARTRAYFLAAPQFEIVDVSSSYVSKAERTQTILESLGLSPVATSSSFDRSCSGSPAASSDGAAAENAQSGNDNGDDNENDKGRPEGQDGAPEQEASKKYDDIGESVGGKRAVHDFVDEQKVSSSRKKTKNSRGEDSMIRLGTADNVDRNAEMLQSLKEEQQKKKKKRKDKNSNQDANGSSSKKRKKKKKSKKGDFFDTLFDNR